MLGDVINLCRLLLRQEICVVFLFVFLTVPRTFPTAFVWLRVLGLGGVTTAVCVEESMVFKRGLNNRICFIYSEFVVDFNELYLIHYIQVGHSSILDAINL